MLRPKNKVVLLTLGQPSTNPRLLKEAIWFSERDCEVHVFYCYWSSWGYYSDETIKTNYPSIQWIEIGGNPINRKVTYLYTRIRYKIIRLIAAIFPKSLFWAERSFCRCYSELFGAIKNIEASLFIAHNLGALPVLGKIASMNNRPFVFDAEDFHRGQYDKNLLNYTQACVIERYWIPKSTMVTAASPFIAEEYKRILGIEMLVIKNVFSLQHIPTRQHNITKSIKLFWFSQTVGKQRGLEDVLSALKFFPISSFSLTIMGDLSTEMNKYFNSLALEQGQRVVDLKFLSPVDPDKVVETAAKFDIGLAIEPGFNDNNNLSYSNKLFTYLLAGNAVILTSTVAQKSFFIKHNNIGWIYPSGNIDALVLILKQILKDSSIVASIKHNARELAETKYNWEIEQQKLMHHLTLLSDNA